MTSLRPGDVRPGAAAEPAPPPPPPDVLARTLGGLAQRLTDLMIRETALLQAGRAGEIAALQLEKQELARAYAGRAAQLRADPAALKGLPASLLGPLRGQLQMLDAVAIENAAALRLMERATSRVLGLVADAAKESRAAITGYDRGRTRPRRAPGILGVTCDRSF